MKFSEQWLRSKVNPNVSQDELVARLSMAGLEVDSVEKVSGEFSGVIVGEIVSIAPHPDADKLRVCQVSDGKQTFQVVCGAPNARQGIKVPFATIGAILSDDFTIKKAKLRGIESFGMLCSANELGISEDNEGLLELAHDASVGENIRTYLNLDDVMIEVDLTPNRGDCLSIRGIAREVGALYQVPVQEIECTKVPVHCQYTPNIDVLDSKSCPRYLGRVIRSVDMGKPTPAWMVERLHRSGIRSIDAVVDVTNYVMLELGQPLHAYDLAQIDQAIHVRKAYENEALTLLNGQEIKLRNDTLIIADATKPLAIAGVMGGEHSGVNDNTKDILLEAAFFDPIAIAGKARSYGLHTDASHRYERGVDWQLPPLAIERATQLLLDIVGGEVGEVVEVTSQQDLPTPVTITLRAERVEKMLGIKLSDEAIEGLLQPLGLQLNCQSSGVWQVTVPSYRYDITIEVDLLEEIARLYGYNRLPVRYPVASLVPHANKQEVQLDKKSLRRLLVDGNYQEAITYSFIDPKLFKLFHPQQTPLLLANPISVDMSAMRQSLWTGLIKALIYNLNRQQTRVRLFEIGLTFEGTLDSLSQTDKIAGLITGSRFPEGWANNKEMADFYDIKADVEAILSLTGLNNHYHFEIGEHSALHPGQTAKIIYKNKMVGFVGALHPELAKALNINQAVYLFELSLKGIEMGTLPTFKELSRFPEVRRDMAILIDKSIDYGEYLEVIRSAAGEYLTNVQLFDVYQGKGVEPHQKSVAVSLTWQHTERTLNDEEVNAFFNQVVTVLKQQFNAMLRM